MKKTICGLYASNGQKMTIAKASPKKFFHFNSNFILLQVACCYNLKIGILFSFVNMSFQLSLLSKTSLTNVAMKFFLSFMN